MSSKSWAVLRINEKRKGEAFFVSFSLNIVHTSRPATTTSYTFIPAGLLVLASLDIFAFVRRTTTQLKSSLPSTRLLAALSRFVYTPAVRENPPPPLRAHHTHSDLPGISTTRDLRRKKYKNKRERERNAIKEKANECIRIRNIYGRQLVKGEGENGFGDSIASSTTTDDRT
jgi:hypothetical protein